MTNWTFDENNLLTFTINEEFEYKLFPFKTSKGYDIDLRLCKIQTFDEDFLEKSLIVPEIKAVKKIQDKRYNCLNQVKESITIKVFKVAINNEKKAIEKVITNLSQTVYDFKEIINFSYDEYVQSEETMNEIDGQILYIQMEIQDLQRELNVVNTTIEADTIQTQIDNLNRQMLDLQMRLL